MLQTLTGVKELIDQAKQETQNQAQQIISRDIYEYINVTQELQHYICYICTKPVHEPINCDQCDKISCSKCIELGAGCPNCKTSIHSRSRLHKIILEQANNFKINLTSKHQLCQKTIHYSAQENHVCDEGFITCKICQQKQIPNQIEKHMLEHYKPIKCERCQEEIASPEEKVIHDHFQEECREKELKIKNNQLQKLIQDEQKNQDMSLRLHLEISKMKELIQENQWKIIFGQNEEVKSIYDLQPSLNPSQKNSGLLRVVTDCRKVIEVPYDDAICGRDFCRADFCGKLLCRNKQQLSDRDLEYLMEKIVQKDFTRTVIFNRQNGTKLISIECKDGKPHGKYIRWFENGNKQFESEYKDGKQHGKYIRWLENGNKQFESECKDGKPHGKYIRWYENGNKLCEIEYKDGKEHGKYIRWYENGNKWFEKEYKDGVKMK